MGNSQYPNNAGPIIKIVYSMVSAAIIVIILSYFFGCGKQKDHFPNTQNKKSPNYYVRIFLYQN
jgi:hypothetical protein